MAVLMVQLPSVHWRIGFGLGDSDGNGGGVVCVLSSKGLRWISVGLVNKLRKSTLQCSGKRNLYSKVRIF